MIFSELPIATLPNKNVELVGGGLERTANIWIFIICLCLSSKSDLFTTRLRVCVNESLTHDTSEHL